MQIFRVIMYILAFLIMIVSTLSANDQNKKKYYLNDLEQYLFMNKMEKDLSLSKKQKKMIGDKYHSFFKEVKEVMKDENSDSTMKRIIIVNNKAELDSSVYLILTDEQIISYKEKFEKRKKNRDDDKIK